MAVFPTSTSKIAALDGQIHAAQKTIATLESLLGGDHDAALSARITSIQNTADSLTESRAFYAAKTSTAGNVPVEILIHNYAQEFSKQAVVFDGWPIMNRDRERADIALRLNTMMARPDDVPPMDTMAGPATVNMAQCQGLIYAGSVLGNAVRDSVDATMAQDAAQPFSAWEDIRAYFNQHFEGHYVPFLSV